jgi:hypothetical protein
MGASDPYERIRAELIQVGNRHPSARRDLDDISRMVARLAHAHDDTLDQQLVEAERRGWDKGYSAGLDKLPGDRQRFPRP